MSFAVSIKAKDEFSAAMFSLYITHLLKVN
jgi:hypothetical protein